MKWLALFFVAGFAAAQTISFLPPANVYEAAVTQRDSICSACVAIADFNGDGKPDIVFAIAPSVVAVQLGNGDGTFRPVGAFFPVNQAMGSPFVGDFNGDGKPDVAISGASTWLYLGKGDGTFSAPIAVLGCSSTPQTELVAVADLNRDGRSDMLCGTTILLSNGDGTFRNGGTAGTFAMETLILTADFNNDGVPDALLKEVSGLFAVALGRGGGTFGSSSIIQTSTQQGSIQGSSVVAGDFNGDGKIDLAGYSYRGFFLDVLPGNGDGTFGAATQTDISATNVYGVNFGGVADFNKDGKPDLIAGDAILAGNGDGTFRFPVFIGPVSDPCGSAAKGNLTCEYTHVSTAIADFNGDGLPDLAAGSILAPGAAVVTVLLDDSSGDGFTTAGISAATFTEPVGAGSIVTAFGVNLAPATEVAAVNPAPTTLGGIRVHVRDRSDIGDSLAPLLYVSPTQINYVLNSSDSFAWVTIERVGLPFVAKGMVVPITSLAPGFFAGEVLTVPANGPATLSPITSPIDLSGAPVYLVFYGTGFDQASTSASECVAGVPLPASYAGPEMVIAGLDQLNVPLPKSFAGSGSLSVTCRIGTASGVVGFTAPIGIYIR